ncbi:hypothetical protein DIURU_002895 [Diutina rugosa]|uniref:D-isomer specific 2-hydroxyacid dehydrogenase NAD-binding domain-containing protein n=1 Tax=Diutina rugosa TaxID=5481 RepID=A0A642UNV1_DIURU|nr:uncharacterized protein DIURU_002895 [Diutina rugosa]KAA8902441.1 hypothetical protein DIURU_002895 [Diutina rugosa]
MTKSGPKCLFLERPNFDSQEYQQFTEHFECVHFYLHNAQELYQEFAGKGADIEYIYGGYIGLGKGYHGAEVKQTFPNLKIIALASVGYDNYNVAELAEAGVTLTNAPSELAYGSVADLALYNALSSFRNFKLFEAHVNNTLNDAATIRYSLHHSEFDSKQGKAVVTPQKGHVYAHSICGRENLSPAGHNTVIVGFGQIGSLIGKRLATIGMNVHYVKRTPLSPEEQDKLGYPITYHDKLEDTVGFADLVVLACPGGKSTYHLVSKQMINKFERPIRIINISRGTVIDENALVEGLETGKVLFAALDVFEEEPKIHPGLIGRQDVVLTPHIGSATIQNFNYTMALALDNVRRVSEGLKPITQVN